METEYSPGYFNSATKTVISSDKCMLYKSFQKVLYRIDNWNNKGPGWIIESIDGECVNIFAYNPLLGSTYIELPNGLKNSMKGLINIKNNDNKCVLWCPVRQLNLVKITSERITKEDKKIINDLDYEGIKFKFQKKIIAKLKDKKIFALMYFVMKMD